MKTKSKKGEESSSWKDSSLDKDTSDSGGAVENTVEVNPDAGPIEKRLHQKILKHFQTQEGSNVVHM